MKTTNHTAHCADCQTPFLAEVVTGEIFGHEVTFGTKYCDQCQQNHESALQTAASDRTRPEWSDICPQVYQNFQRELLPPTSQAVAQKAFEWQAGSKGIGLFGQSRTGKTYILHELMRRHYDAGTSVHLTSSVDFAYNMGSPDQSERREEMSRCINADLLLFDDIGKEKLTNRVESDLYRVFEKRRQNLKPLFTSVNSDGDTLARAMSNDAGWPIINRLKYDLCDFHQVPPLPEKDRPNPVAPTTEPC